MFHTPLHSTPPVGVSPSEYCHPVRCEKTRMVGTLEDGKNFEHNNRLDTILACDRQTNRRTDRQTSCDNIVRPMHTRRAVKTIIQCWFLTKCSNSTSHQTETQSGSVRPIGWSGNAQPPNVYGFFCKFLRLDFMTKGRRLPTFMPC